MCRPSRTRPADCLGQSLANAEPVGEGSQRVESNMANNLTVRVLVAFISEMPSCFGN